MTRRVRIPADVDRPDRILAGLTARQVVILACGALVLLGGYWVASPIIPLPALLFLAIPVVALAAGLALGQRDGLPGDLFALAALRHALSPRRRVAAPEEIPALPANLAAVAGAPPSPLGLPVHAVYSSGIIDLGDAGSALLARASSVNFALRSAEEQDALVAAFGRFLNAMNTPFQIVVRVERVDLGGTAARLESAAASLGHPALEEAARGHAAFLRSLSARRDLVHREILLVLRENRRPDGAASNLRQRGAEATALLREAGITLRLLDGAEALTTLVRAADPEAVPPGTVLPPDEPTTGRRRS